MKTAAVANQSSDVNDSTIAAALWVLAATAWFVMAVLFVRHGLFSAVLLLLVALICLPGIRAAFRQQTGIRITGMATGAAILALAVGGIGSASRNFEMRQSSQPATSRTGTDTAGDSMLRPSVSEAVQVTAPTAAQSVFIAGNAQ